MSFTEINCDTIFTTTEEVKRFLDQSEFEIRYDDGVFDEGAVIYIEKDDQVHGTFVEHMKTLDIETKELYEAWIEFKNV